MNFISSIKRNQIKKKVIKTILSCPQENNSVINIHRIDPSNVGDFYSAPYHYFKELQDSSLDIFDYKDEKKEVQNNFIHKICTNSLIIGGGGLLNRSGFSRQMAMFEQLTEKNKKIVLWGIGHNEKHFAKNGRVKKYNIDISRFTLAGTRDYSMPGLWVPCASCLHPLFDQKYSETRELGIVFHKDTLRKSRILIKFNDIPSTSNTTNLDSLINFIGSCESVITDSYHTMYWALLLNKKVVAIPNSSKFFDFKYSPVFSSFRSCLEDVKKTQRHEGILEECREVNLHFAEKAFNYLNI